MAKKFCCFTTKTGDQLLELSGKKKADWILFRQKSLFAGQTSFVWPSNLAKTLSLPNLTVFRQISFLAKKFCGRKRATNFSGNCLGQTITKKRSEDFVFFQNFCGAGNQLFFASHQKQKNFFLKKKSLSNDFVLVKFGGAKTLSSLLREKTGNQLFFEKKKRSEDFVFAFAGENRQPTFFLKKKSGAKTKSSLLREPKPFLLNFF